MRQQSPLLRSSGQYTIRTQTFTQVSITFDSCCVSDPVREAEEPLLGTKPSRGVVEAKPTSDDTLLTADGAQVSKCLKGYGQVLVTNYRKALAGISDEVS
jgi:hypothetical protein